MQIKKILIENPIRVREGIINFASAYELNNTIKCVLSAVRCTVMASFII